MATTTTTKTTTANTTTAMTKTTKIKNDEADVMEKSLVGKNSRLEINEADDAADG